MLRLFAILLLCTPVWAQIVRGPFDGVRPSGMGNAFLAISDDANALFYNPAGLAYVKGGHLNLIDVNLGFDGMGTLGKITKVVGGDYSTFVQNGSSYANLAVLPTLVFPGFALSIFDNARGFFNFENLNVLPAAKADVTTFNDLGIMAGAAIPFGESLSLGVSVRAFERTAVDIAVTSQQLIAKMLSTQSADINGTLTKMLKDASTTGWGLGVNLGLLLRVPLSPGAPKWTFGAVVDDIGETTFHAVNGGLKAPAAQRQSYNLGTALSYPAGKGAELNVAVDIRDAFQGLPFLHTLHVGAEYRTKVLAFRAGYSQGYLTAGASLEFPHHTRIHFATYEVDPSGIGAGTFQRVYLVQFAIGFNPL